MMKTFRLNLLLLTCVLGLIPGSVSAWWGAGHMVVGTIAYKHLEPNVRTQVDSLILVLQEDYPYTNHFIAAATWPDDLKAEGVHFYDTWHYTNNHYNPDNVVLPAMPEVDVIWAIDQSVRILKSNRSRNIEKARALAFLIHFVGDIHQPLHAGSMFSNDMPGGDIGGNRYKIIDNHGSLHKLWDDGCGLTSDLNDIDPYGVPKEPLSQEEIKRLEKFADEITNAQPMESFADLHQMEPDLWGLESAKLARKYAYSGFNGEVEGRRQYLNPGGEPTTVYLEAAKKVVEKQLAKAGYRLAILLNQTLGA